MAAQEVPPTASVLQYAKIMRDTQWSVALKIGLRLDFTDVQTRCVDLSNLAVQALLIQLLVNKGIITNEELLMASNALRSDPFELPPEPLDPVEWDTTPITGF